MSNLFSADIDVQRNICNKLNNNIKFLINSASCIYICSFNRLVLFYIR